MIPFGVDQATIIIGNLALTLKYPDRFPIIYRDRSQSILGCFLLSCRYIGVELSLELKR